MKKIISLVLVAVMLLTLCFALASCGEKVKCSICKEEFRAKDKNVTAKIGDYVTYMCDDCLESANDIKDGLEGLFGDKN